MLCLLYLSWAINKCECGANYNDDGANKANLKYEVKLEVSQVMKPSSPPLSRVIDRLLDHVMNHKV